MSNIPCEECSSPFSPSHPKNKFCSRTCANKAHKSKMQLAGARQRECNIEKYNQNPVRCNHCSTHLSYSNRKGKFCSHSCAATFHNMRTPRRRIPRSPQIDNALNCFKPVKSWSKICPITGQKFTDQMEYRNREWSPYPNGRIQTIKLLALTFGITLGCPDASERLTAARSTLQEAYINDQLSTLEIHKKFKFSCTPGHVSNFLKALNISRRSLSHAASAAILSGRTVPNFYKLNSEYKYKCGFHQDWEGALHYYRSGYELKYYKWLDDANISYKTESIRIQYYDTILGRQRVAIPDIIIDDRIILEIKSSWTYNKANMIDKVISYKALGYDIILCIDFKDYLINSISDLP